jgi:hypothetical protein
MSGWARILAVGIRWGLVTVLVAGVATSGYFGWRSRSWPLVHDAPLMHYIAWLIGQGATPYRDVFDMNLPGVYLVHVGVLAIAGPGDLAWRIFDLGWLAGSGALLFIYCRPLGGTVGGLAAALLFALCHVAGGAWRAGQRDFLICAFLLAGSHALAGWWERGAPPRALAGAGAWLGGAMLLKPHVALFWMMGAALAALGAWRRGRSALAAAAVVTAAGLAPGAVVLGWLAGQGGLPAFASTLGGYVVPLYSQAGRVSAWEALRWHVYGWPLLALLGALAALGLLSRLWRPLGLREWLALLGVGYGAAHFVLQSKGWEYHLYPLLLFLCAMAAPAIGDPPGARGPGPRAQVVRAVACLVLAGAVGVLAAKAADAIDAGWIADKMRTVDVLEADLRPMLSAGATAQVMDTSAGGIHALLRLGVRQPTRFIYDFHFFHDEGDPRIEALRAEFAAGLAAGRPAAIVVLRDSWPRPGYDRLERFPAVKRLLDRDYRLEVERDAYRIYAKRGDS